MRLLYVWINRSGNGVFEKQGVSFSEEYRVSYDAASYALTIEPNRDYHSIFGNSVIQDVTAIVGANGVGKTTLLKYLFNQDLEPEPTDVAEAFRPAEYDEYAGYKAIYVIVSDGTLKVLHNLDQDIVVHSPTNIDVKRSVNGKWPLAEIETMTKVYLSNGFYDTQMMNGHSLSFGGLRRVALTTHSLSGIGKSFFSNLCGMQWSMFKRLTSFNNLQKVILDTKKPEEFQAVCDVLYFQKLLQEKRLESFAARVLIHLTLESTSLLGIMKFYLDKRKKERDSFVRAHENMKHGMSDTVLISEKLSQWYAFQDTIKAKPIDLVTLLKCNLIFEMDYICDACTAIARDNDIDTIIQNCLRQLAESEQSEHLEYYQCAQKEIEELSTIIAGCPTITNLWPGNNYLKTVKIHSLNNRSAYVDFLHFVEKRTEAQKSFVLKYLRIGNLHMSSGERAYLNLFSWLNLLPFFNRIDPGVQELGNTILLLVDEIDLYCHPEWQRKMVKYLLEELEIQFPKKKIQIIFATHSPILLSDVPLANTVHISRGSDGGSRVDARAEHKETFASSIYRLFNDSFFLESTGAIGEFAVSEINKVLERIKSNAADERTLAVLSMIGEPVIKHKLERMYYQYCGEGGARPVSNYFSRDDRFKRIRHQLESLLSEIDDEMGERC